MKKILILLAAVSFMICGFGGPAPDSTGSSAPSGAFLIDDFENGNYSDPEWWKFDNIMLNAVDNSSYGGGDVGKYSLRMKGMASNWYVGGCGTYLAKPKTNYSAYNAFQMDVYGNGPGSGTLQIELYDDDNGNWQVEQDPKKAYMPIYDDKLQRQIVINWKGWKTLTLPFADFDDANPNVGDDIWNPNQNGGSGGFLQIQLIALGPKKSGNVNFNIDNVMLVK
jgi:hypothetical protein